MYLGSAPRFEHLIILRMLSPRQVRLITGATTRLGPVGAEVPLEYYAVRDPSVVRVVPVDRAPVNSFRHVHLVFQIDRPQLLPDAVSVHPRMPGGGGPPCAFLLTVGLPLSREEQFYSRAIADPPVGPFADLFGRLHQMGRVDG